MLFPNRSISNLEKVQDGKLQRCPNFCKNLKPKCLEFYKNNIGNHSLIVCPYGFAVQYVAFVNGDCFFIALQIEGVNKEKDIKKKLLKNENIIPLNTEQYNILIKEMQERIILKRQEESLKEEVNLELKRIQERKNLIEDTIHEIRKINNQLNSSLEQLLDVIEPDNKYVLDITKGLYGNTNLLSIRLDFYDYMSNPELFLNAAKSDIPIYKKFDKVYKCLYSEREKKKIEVKLEGNSYGIYSASPMLEIAIFIIIENAIKYSPENQVVLIKFNESFKKKHLAVSIENWGPIVSSEELSHLTDRGFRSKAVLETAIEGQGIGLHLLSQICKSNDIDFYFDTKGNAIFNGKKYSTFVVTLDFNGIMI